MSTLKIEQNSLLRRKQIFEYLCGAGTTLSTSEIMRTSECNRSTLLNDLNELRRRKQLVMTRVGNSYYWSANV